MQSLTHINHALIFTCHIYQALKKEFEKSESFEDFKTEVEKRFLLNARQWEEVKNEWYAQKGWAELGRFLRLSHTTSNLFNFNLLFKITNILKEMITHEIELQAHDGQKWGKIESFVTTSRYLLKKAQRECLNALKYECELAGLETRTVKRKEIVKWNQTRTKQPSLNGGTLYCFAWYCWLVWLARV